jgi:hypothetical protein
MNFYIQNLHLHSFRHLTVNFYLFFCLPLELIVQLRNTLLLKEKTQNRKTKNVTKLIFFQEHVLEHI